MSTLGQQAICQSLMHDPEVATVQLLTWLFAGYFSIRLGNTVCNRHGWGVGYVPVQSLMPKGKIPVQMGDLAAAIEKALPPAVPAGRDFGSGPIGEGSLSTGRAALSVSGEIATGAWVGSERQANQRRKRLRARLLHDGGATVLDRALADQHRPGGARAAHRPVADVVLTYAVKSYREALHCCGTVFRRCSRPNQDGALLNRRVDDSLLAVVDPVESWTARQHLCACGGKSTIKTTPNPLLIAPVLYEK
jgi:hypothetical protein